MQNSANAPIYAFSPYGLANRLLGLASAMHLCAILNRPLVLVWKLTADIGHVEFHALYQNDLHVMPHPPIDLYTVLGNSPLSVESFPASIPTLLICHDLCLFPGINKKSIRPYLRSLRPMKAIEEQLLSFTTAHSFENTVGVHLRKGDKWRGLPCKASRRQIEDQYNKVIRLIILQSNLQIYLSCDDLAEQLKYKQLYGSRIIFSRQRENPLKRNSRSLPDAVIDLHLLSHTKAVLYGAGTFGYTAYVMGPTKGGNILYSKSDFFYFFPELLGLIPDCFPKPEAIVASAISDK